MSRPGLFLAFTFRKGREALLGAGLALAGCETGQPGTPALTPAVLAAGANRGASSGDLARGREVFATDCTACHRMQPIGKFPTDVWRGIVADMSQRAHLTEPDRAKLLAYITAARQAMH